MALDAPKREDRSIVWSVLLVDFAAHKMTRIFHTAPLLRVSKLGFYVQVTTDYLPSLKNVTRNNNNSGT
jgi:hypothetical protein